MGCYLWRGRRGWKKEVVRCFVEKNYNELLYPANGRERDRRKNRKFQETERTRGIRFTFSARPINGYALLHIVSFLKRVKAEWSILNDCNHNLCIAVRFNNLHMHRKPLDDDKLNSIDHQHARIRTKSTNPVLAKSRGLPLRIVYKLRILEHFERL